MAPEGRAGDPVDVMLVSLGSTQGLRAADEQLRESLQRAGANVAVARAIPPREIPTMMLTDLAWALAARTAASAMLGQLERTPPRAIIYSSTTAALLWPAPGAVRFDAPSRANRPGRHGLWQRPLERRRLAQARLLLAWSSGGLAEAGGGAAQGERALVLPVSVAPSGPSPPARSIAAITYAANPSKKGLDRVLGAWRRVRAERRSLAGAVEASEELVIAGAPLEDLRRAGVIEAEEPGVRIVGRLAGGEYRALLRRARVFVCAPRREDYGIAQLEALADGCQLLTTPAPGPYAALPIARALDPRLVGEDLEAGLRVALEDPLPGYAERARPLLDPFTRETVDRVVAEELLPRLLA